MKNKLRVLGVLLLVVGLIFTSCKKDEEEVKVFKFTADGIVYDFSENISTGLNLFKMNEIKGSEGKNSFSIILSDWSTGTFTEEDFNFSLQTLKTDFNLTFKKDTLRYSYYESVSNARFKINVTEAENASGGKIKGTFNGYLYQTNIFSAVLDSVEVTNGEFTTFVD